MKKKIKPPPGFSQRRQFIEQSLKAVAAAALVQIPGLVSGKSLNSPEAYTVQEIINLILKEIPGAPFPNTVDTLKSGSPDQQVTGIVSCMFATVAVIEQTVRLGANFIIAHEPSFYNHTDDPNWVMNNQVVIKKQELLKKYQITIWRFHDYWHTHRPDGIRYGVLKKAGWLEYDKEIKTVFNIPATTLGSMTEHLKRSLGIAHVRVLGDLKQSCTKIALMPGAAGGQSQISMVEKEKPDVLIVGEVHEWETAEYIRDSRQLGSGTALVILGHSVSEEPGMDWLVEWLQPKLQGIKVTHIASGDPFIWV